MKYLDGRNFWTRFYIGVVVLLNPLRPYPWRRQWHRNDDTQMPRSVPNSKGVCRIIVWFLSSAKHCAECYYFSRHVVSADVFKLCGVRLIVRAERGTINYSNLDLFDIPAGDPNKKNSVRLRDKGVWISQGASVWTEHNFTYFYFFTYSWASFYLCNYIRCVLIF